MATGWPTAGSLLAWAPFRQSTSTTTRPSPLSPTKSHLSSSRKSLPESAFSQLGVNPLWSLWWHPPTTPPDPPSWSVCPRYHLICQSRPRQIVADNWIDLLFTTQTCCCVLFYRYNCRQEFQIHDDILKTNYKVGRISDTMPEHYLVQVIS